MSTSHRCAWMIAAAGLTLTACGSSDAHLPKEVTNALEVCFNRNDAQACTDLFRDDAEIFPHGASVVRGREAIHDWFRQQVATEFMFDTESKEQLLRDGIAIDQGTYRIRNVMAGKDVELGNYLHVWTRGGGDWKLYRVMYNTEVAPRASVSVGPETAEAQTGR